MSARRRQRLLVMLVVGAVAASVGSIPGLLDARGVENAGEWGFRGYGLVAGGVFVFCGALLAAKRPENPVGWLFSVVGLAFAVQSLADLYGVIPLLRGSDSDLVYNIVWVNSWIWIVFLALTALAVFLFPTGTPPGPRWRGRARFMVITFAMGALGFAFAPGPLNNVPTRFRNRYALPESPITEALLAIGMSFFMVGLVIAVWGVIHRFGRSRGIQRQQMKLFVLAAASMVASMVLVVVSEFFMPAIADAAEILASMSIMAIPISMVVAILRYRLYEIDVVINRALVYATLTGVLALSYLGIVVLLQTALAPITRESDLAVAGSTLAVAALFRPLRARVQTFIDRRFYRRRYDAAETLRNFSTRLRDEIELDALSHDLVGVVGQTMQPAHASLWLREPEVPR